MLPLRVIVDQGAMAIKGYSAFPKDPEMSKAVLFQAIQFRMCTDSLSKRFYFKIQFTISSQFSSIWHKAWTLSSATTTGHSRPGSDGNKGVLCIPQSFTITGASSSDCLTSYLGHSLRCILQPRLTGPILFSVISWHS